MMKGGEIKPCRTRLLLPMIQAQKNETAALGVLSLRAAVFCREGRGHKISIDMAVRDNLYYG